MKKRLPKISIHDFRSTGRKSPWCVLYYYNRLRKRRYFTTLAEALCYRDELAAKLRAGLTPSDDAEVERLVAGTGYTKLALVTLAIGHLRNQHQVPPDTDPIARARARNLIRLGVTALKAAKSAQSQRRHHE